MIPAKKKSKEGDKKSTTFTASMIINNEVYALVPTPIAKDNPYMQQANMLSRVAQINREIDDTSKRAYSEVEENERVRKRSRADQILSLNHTNDTLVTELQNTARPGNRLSKCALTSSLQRSCYGRRRSIPVALLIINFTPNLG